MISASGDLLPVLTANMLGEDETPPLESQRDALGEIANVICGNALPRLAGSHAVFRLDAPQAALAPQTVAGSVQTGAQTAADQRLACVLALPLDGGTVELRLYLAAAATAELSKNDLSEDGALSSDAPKRGAPSPDFARPTWRGNESAHGPAWDTETRPRSHAS